MKGLISIGAIFSLLAVILGAFGAHALAPHLGTKLPVWHTGVQYQMFHGIAIILTGVLMIFLSNRRLLKMAGIAFILGTLCFSGSLYTIGLIQVKNVGYITPIGGLLFIIGWGLFLSAVLTSKVDILSHK